MNGRLQQWLFILVSLMILLRTESFFVDITYVQSAVAKGGGERKCLIQNMEFLFVLV